jgi:hypothetical protein
MWVALLERGMREQLTMGIAPPQANVEDLLTMKEPSSVDIACSRASLREDMLGRVSRWVVLQVDGGIKWCREALWRGQAR